MPQPGNITPDKQDGVDKRKAISEISPVGNKRFKSAAEREQELAKINYETAIDLLNGDTERDLNEARDKLVALANKGNYHAGNASYILWRFAKATNFTLVSSKAAIEYLSHATFSKDIDQRYKLRALYYFKTNLIDAEDQAAWSKEVDTISLSQESNASDYFYFSNLKVFQAQIEKDIDKKEEFVISASNNLKLALDSISFSDESEITEKEIYDLFQLLENTLGSPVASIELGRKCIKANDLPTAKWHFKLALENGIIKNDMEAQNEAKENIKSIRTILDHMIIETNQQVQSYKKLNKEMNKKIENISSVIKDLPEKINTINATLLYHTTRLDKHTGELQSHETRLNKQEKRLDKHETRLDKIDTIIEKHENRLDKHDIILEEHSTELKKHAVILNRHTNEILNHTNILNNHTNELLGHTNTLQNLTDRADGHDKQIQAIANKRVWDLKF